MNRDSDDGTRGAPTPMCSRRSFMRVAATSGGAGLLSAGLLPMIVRARVGSPSQVVLPPATPEIGPFKVHVPQAVLEDRYSTDASGYASIQGTRPQTLGYGLADSPVGQAMWIYEKFQGWTDNKGDPEEAISLDHMLDDITLYWLTNTAASSARIYYESFRKDFVRMPLELPIAVSIFKGDMFTPPKVWGERTYSKLFYWNEVPRGGHFAALEQPQLFVSELRKAFRQVR